MSATTLVRMLTPAGIGGIAVVELAGADAERMLRACFTPPGIQDVTFEPARICYGHILQRTEPIDEVIVTRLSGDFPTPVFEINCHGGMVPARRIIGLFVEQGARESDGGDALFGRPLRRLERQLLDQLVHARTQLAADVLLVQLAGGLRAELERIATRAPGDDVRTQIERLRSTWAFGRRLVEPATVVITGAPNVGKSTLANALVGRERSIVHHLPGTTRDAVSSVASLEGLPVVVVDTAGLREATDEIERIGVARAVAKATLCDLVVWVFDHSRDVTGDEARYLQALKGPPLVPVINKTDLAGPLDVAKLRALTGADVQRTCALTGRGIEELRARLLAALVGAERPKRGEAVLTLREIDDDLAKAAQKIDSGRAGDYLLEPSLFE